MQIATLLLFLPLLGLSAVAGFGLAAARSSLRHRDLPVSDPPKDETILAGRGTALTKAIEASGAGIIVTDFDNRIVAINGAMVKILGFSQEHHWKGASARPLWRLVRQSIGSGPGLELLENDLPKNNSLSVEIKTTEEPTRTFLVESNAILGSRDQRVGRLTLVHDLTEKVLVQEQILQTRTMEAIATLAGGVAHGFNNKLTAILGNARRIREAGSEMSDTTKNDLNDHLDELESAADYCARLTSGLLSFSAQVPVRAESVRVTKILNEAQKILFRDMPDRIELKIKNECSSNQKPGDIRFVRCAPAELVQILVHLVDNARRAIDMRGLITVRASDFTAKDRNGEWVRFEVEDNGRGMDRSTREHAFDPFFSTQAVGQGMGLGLSIAHGLVQAQGGWFEVNSEPKIGTRCAFYLPEGEATSELANKLEPDVGHSQLILVADDEAPLRRLIRLALERRGYRVLEAIDGKQALELFLEHQSEVVMAILDLSMPNLDGLQVIERIHNKVPTLPIILSSGYFGERPPPDDESVAILPKPYSPDQLVDMVKRSVTNEVSPQQRTPSQPN